MNDAVGKEIVDKVSKEKELVSKVIFFNHDTQFNHFKEFKVKIDKINADLEAHPEKKGNLAQ